MTPVAKELAYLFRCEREARPIFLLGAGASFRSGIPMAAEAVKRIAREAYSQKFFGVDARRGNPKPSDWKPFLEQQEWFIPSEERLAENFPLAVHHFLQPDSFRREFMCNIIRPRHGINAGYRHLGRIMMRRLCRTVLTTNFDALTYEALHELQPHIGEIIEINKTEDDLVRFSINNRNQIVYLHGKAEFYRARLGPSETQRLDDQLVRYLRPLLRDAPLIVIGYRGFEPSVMTHLLEEGIDEVGPYRYGIWWCELKGKPLHENTKRLQKRLGQNFKRLEIEGFDELMEALDKELKDDTLYTGISSPTASVAATHPYDHQPLPEFTLDDLDTNLILATLAKYCDRLGLSAVTAGNYTHLMLEQGLLAEYEEKLIPTVGGYLLFGKNVTERFPYVRVALYRGKARRVFSGNLLQQYTQIVQHLTDPKVNQLLRVKGKRSAEEKSAYPERALVELLVNMLVHRDYEIDDISRIRFRPGRSLNFQNVGGLMPRVRDIVQVSSDGEFQPVRGESQLRNSTLADIFYGLGSMDKQGSGLPDVKDLMHEHGGGTRFIIQENNHAFRATLYQPIQASPRKSRAARPVTPTEVYITNLLPFRVLPERMWRMPIERNSSRRKFFEDENPSELPVFIRHGGELITFANLEDYPDFSSRRGNLLELRPPTPVPDLLTEPEGRNLFVWLIKQHWVVFLNSLRDPGLRVKSKQRRAYFTLVDGTRNRICYDARIRKNQRRDVVKQRKRGRWTEYESEGIYFSIVEFGMEWAVQIKPFYMFLRSDGVTPLPSHLLGSRSTRRIKYDRNQNVEHDLVFWARFLSDAQPIINIGGTGVDDLILDAEYCSVELSMSPEEGQD